ncbi:MAG: endolytic transglycosylase MltG [Gordonia sp. (in: high G+C Gram-positive bacteria)]
MTDERHRRRDPSDHPTEGIDLDRLRYFTQPADGKPINSHRRRRMPTGATGQIPVVGSAPDSPPRAPNSPPRAPHSQPRAPQDPPAWVVSPAPEASTDGDGGVRPAGAEALTRPRQRSAVAARRRRRRIVLALVLSCLLVAVAGVGYVKLRERGVFESRKDYTNAAGTADVIVDIPQDSTLMDFARILTEDGVVGSERAFLKAANGQVMSGGFYKLRTQIPAATAVALLTDGTTHRVGRVVIPEGLQLDTKQGADGKSTPGIFQLIADATSATINGTRRGVTVADLQRAAATDTVEQLGIPAWAASAVTALNGDHRRIEGLIAPGTWERLDPTFTATALLRELITQSVARFEAWGVLTPHSSGLSPYATLTAASVVEREVTMAGDYPKVARVILNRIAKGQRLQMDSTANYTASVTDIDVHGEAYRARNVWNTYQIPGLPATPIGAVGERALAATENPARGGWLYFVTIDRDGTTVFADNFEQHQRNRERACANKLLATGCS